VIFFFSSRRRHTRWPRDWSSDVCSSDLTAFGLAGLAHVRAAHPEMPYPDMAVRNVFEGQVRTTGGADRLDAIGAVDVHRVSEGRSEERRVGKECRCRWGRCD